MKIIASVVFVSLLSGCTAIGAVKNTGLEITIQLWLVGTLIFLIQLKKHLVVIRARLMIRLSMQNG